MGYTHYWNLKKRPTSKQWVSFTSEVKTILTHPAIAPLVCREYDRVEEPPQVDEQLVAFNGKGDLGHETFHLPRDVGESFCKTGGLDQADWVEQWGKSYDLAVCCVLLAAHRHLKLCVSSDGDWDYEGWVRARVLYAKTFACILPPLWKVKSCAKCERSFSAEGHAWGGSERCVKCNGGSANYRYDGDRQIKICMSCHGKKWKRQAPKDWCYFCSNGYETKEEAATALKGLWAKVMEQFDSMRGK
jgi:hypothetical protein